MDRTHPCCGLCVAGGPGVLHGWAICAYLVSECISGTLRALRCFRAADPMLLGMPRGLCTWGAKQGKHG